MATMDTPQNTQVKTNSLELKDLKKEAKQLEEYLNIASVSKVLSHQPKTNGPINFTFLYSQRKIAANRRRSTVLSTTLMDPTDLDSFGPVSTAFDIQDALVSQPSPSRKHTFIAKPGDGPDSAVFEIWEGPRCIRCLQIPKKVHGAVLNDGLFSGGAAWSHDETKIVYIADAATGETLPDWGTETETENNKEKEDSKTGKVSSKTWSGIGQWEESWGEALTNVKNPSIFVLDIVTSTVLSFEKTLPKDYSFGQAVWTPKSDGIVFAGWPHCQSNFNDVAMKLGYLFCKNRPCSLFYIPLEASTDDKKKPYCLTEELLSGSLPCFSPDGNTLVFISNQHAVETGIHDSSSRLYSIDWSEVGSKLAAGEKPDLSTHTKLIVGEYNRPAPPLNFPGIYWLRDSPMTSIFLDNDRLIMTTTWGFQAVIITVRLSTGEICPLNPIGMTKESYVLLCWKSGVMIASRASLTSGPCLVAKRVDSTDPWVVLQEDLQSKLEPNVQKVLENLEQQELRFDPKNYPNGKPESPVQCESVLVRKKGSTEPQPTILIPHGGPHSAMFQLYAPSAAQLVSMGAALLIVNFRGSLSYGTDFTMALPGHVGQVDVEDCMQALDLAIEKGYTDADKVCVSGGSHGGFLGGHLVGQYPDRFKCAILRNPAIALEHMVYSTDIPDWVFVECFGSKEKNCFSVIPSAKQQEQILSKSPARYIEQVKAPMLFMLGGEDKRVPALTSMRYIAALKSRKDAPEVRVLVFPSERHPLDSPQTEFETSMNIMWWLKKHKILE